MAIIPYGGKFSRAFFADRIGRYARENKNLNSGVNMTSLLEMRMRGAGIDDRRPAVRVQLASLETRPSPSVYYYVDL